MRIPLPFRLLTAACLALAMLAAPAPALADDKSRVKAAMVFNIMRFTNFPGAQRTLRLCGLRSDETAAHLRSLDGRSVGRATVDVVLVARVSDLGASCNVIYVDSASYSSIGAARRGQLVIGARRGFAESGGTVGADPVRRPDPFCGQRAGRTTYGGPVQRAITPARGEGNLVASTSYLIEKIGAQPFRKKLTMITLAVTAIALLMSCLGLIGVQYSGERGKTRRT